MTPGPDALKQSGERLPANPSTWVMVRYNSPHAAYVHEGTRPHWPPKGVLLRWIQIKLAKTAAEARRLDYVIRRKIARFGTRPNPFLLRAVGMILPFIDRFFERAFADASSRLEQRFRR